MGYSEGARYEDYGHLMNKKVTVKGELYHGHSGWHVTRVLPRVDRIQPR